jgi:hypothetical protein
MSSNERSRAAWSHFVEVVEIGPELIAEPDAFFYLVAGTPAPAST